MTSRLWVRHAMLLIGVSAISVGIALVGMNAFSWANEFVLEGYLPPRVEAELQALEAQAEPILAELDAIYATWLTPAINYQRAGLMFGIAAVCVTLAMIIAIVSARWITRPVDVLAIQVRKLVDGDLGARNPEGHDLQAYGAEISALMVDMNKLANTLEERENRVRSDTAMIAHELRTPLTAIISHLHAIQDGIVEANAEAFAILMSRAHSLERVVDDMRTISLVDAGRFVLHRERINLADVLAEAVEHHKRAFEDAGISLDLNLKDVAVMADRHRLLQVVRAAVQNVLDHAEGATCVRLMCHGSEHGAVLEIADNGVGFTSECDAATIFEPFKRHKETSQNSGLGLAVVAAIVDANGGRTEIRHADGPGFHLEITIPTDAD